MKVQVYIEGQRIDLFEDEGISITQGVQDVRDISKLFADFSQSFKVPASDNNNAIFKHYYNADIDGGFDARTRKLATIDVNTLDFKRGKIQLEDVEIKDNQPSMYKITFYGDTIKIKDLIGDDELFTLDWLSNFNHDYDEAQVELGLTEGLDFTVDGVTYEDAVVYPLISYTRQYFYNSDPTDTTSTDTLVNIAYDVGRTDGVNFGDLKPAIKLSLIIEAIAIKYGFNFTGGFFESMNYKDAYVSLNNSTDTLNSGFLQFESETGNITALSSFGARLEYRCSITPDPLFTSVPYTILLTYNGQTVYENETPFFGTQTVTAIIDDPDENYDITAAIITQSDFYFSADTRLIYREILTAFDVLEINSYPLLSINLQTVITNLLYDIKTYDFLTSVFKMFNLIVYSDNTDLVVEDLQSWYSQGKIYDISQYVDNKKLKIAKGRIYNQLNYKFEDSDQIIADQYNENNRYYYGNIEFKLYENPEQTILIDGETLDIEVVFENPIFERLLNLNDGILTPIQYCPYFDKEIKPLSGNPFMFYVDDVNISGFPIGFRGENTATYRDINTSIFMPSHSRVVSDDTTFALNFEAERSEYTYGVMSNSIFQTYFKDYISDIFSTKRRNYELTAILPDFLLNKLKLNDRVLIGDRRYLINKLTSDIVNRKDSFELINDIYDAPIATDTLSGGVFRTNGRFYNSEGITDTVDYIGESVAPALLNDLGDGTTWVTINSTIGTGVRTVNFTVDPNTTVSQRTVQITINNTKSIARFNIIQRGTVGTAFDFSSASNSALMNTILTAKS